MKYHNTAVMLSAQRRYLVNNSTAWLPEPQPILGPSTG